MPQLFPFYYLCQINPLKIMELLNYFYHPDHASTGLSTSLGSSASTGLSNLWITDNTGRPIQHLHYLPFGEDWVDQRTTSWNAPYTFSGKEKDVETGYGYVKKLRFFSSLAFGNGKQVFHYAHCLRRFGARYYDSGLSIWLSVDPMSDKYPSMSPYNYCANNPVIFVDPDGRTIEDPSTHIDENGKVITVIDDGDNGVYQHGPNADGGTPTEYMIKRRQEIYGNTSANGKKVGETEYWDEFVSPETGKPMTNYVLQLGTSFDPIISKMAAIADNMDLMDIASESGGGGKFDIKVPYKNVGALLNGKYATSRSAGNYLAGYNAQGGTMFGVGISFKTFQKLAGALHVKGSLSNAEKANIVLFGKSYGSPPTYGEYMYQYRMSKAGWDASKE